MIVITTPTGQIGRQVARTLVEAGKSVRVIARDPAKLDPAIRDGAEVVVGSHGETDVVERAFAGASALFWLTPNLMTRTLEESFVDFARPAAAAIRRNVVAHVVGVTAVGRGTRWQERAGLVTASIRMDDVLMGSGAAFRGLAMPSFMENIARQAQPMREKGMFFGPIDPDVKLPWTATRDMAAKAVQLLSDTEWAGQEEIPVIGPEALSHTDIAQILSEVSGRPIRYQQTGWDQFREGFIARGASASFADGYTDMYRAKAEGMDGAAAAGAELQPTDFRTWAGQVLAPAIAG